MDLGFKIQKTNLVIKIRILKIPSVPIFRQIDKSDLFGPNLAKNGFLVRIKKTNVETRVRILEIPTCICMLTLRQNE